MDRRDVGSPARGGPGDGGGRGVVLSRQHRPGGLHRRRPVRFGLRRGQPLRSGVLHPGLERGLRPDQRRGEGLLRLRPETTPQFQNACTEAACAPFDDAKRLTKLTPDGGLPPLPAKP